MTVSCPGSHPRPCVSGPAKVSPARNVFRIALLPRIGKAQPLPNWEDTEKVPGPREDAKKNRSHKAGKMNAALRRGFFV